MNLNKNLKFLIDRYKLKTLNPRIAVLRGGTGSGKTFSALQFLIAIALKNYAQRIHVVGVTYPHLKLGAFADCKKIISNWGLDADINNSDLEIKIKNASIKFIAADKAEKLRGLRRDILYVNELNLIDRPFFDELVVRTHDFIVVDFNPVRKFWIIDYFLEKNLDISQYEIVTTYQDNVHLPASVKQEIESRSQTDWFKAMGLGEWGAEGDVVLYNYEIVNEPKIKHFLGIGLDIGYTISPSAAVLLGKTTDDKIYAKELFKGCYTINEILDKLSEYRKKYHVIVDAAEKDIIETLRRLGYSAWESKKPSLKASYEKINMRKLAIDASSIELIREIRNLTWKDKIKGVTAGEDHLIDAMRYAYHSFVE